MRSLHGYLVTTFFGKKKYQTNWVATSFRGRLKEVVAYKNLDLTGSKFSSLAYGNDRDLPQVSNVLFM